MFRSVASRVTGVLLLLLGAAFIGSCSGEFTAPPPANRAPVATIKSPAVGAGFGAGQTITFSGSGVDAEDGAVPATAMTWWVEVRRGAQVQMVVPHAAGATSGSFVVPLRDGLSVDMTYRIHLEVRDLEGLADTATRELSPTTAAMRLETVPAGLQVMVDGATFTAPHELASIVGMPRDVAVSSPQALGSSQWAFEAWSDGGERAHTVAPASASTYRATFVLVPPANQPPTVALTAPTAGTSLVQGAATMLRASAADADGAVTEVQFYDGAVLVGSDATAPYEIAWTPATPGAHSLSARAIDDDGAGTSSAAVAVTVTAPPNVAPTVSLTGPAADSTVSFGSVVTLRAHAADADGQVASVAFFDGAALIGTVPTAPYTLAWSPASAGAHVVTARATDNVGATTTSSPVTVTVQPPANQPPTVAITTPAAGATLALGAPVVLAATAADADGAVARVEFLVAGIAVGMDDSAPFQFAWTPTTAGPVTIAARAIDDDGAVTTSDAVAVTVAPPPNQPPQVALTAPANNTTHTIGTPITLRASATDADGTVARVEFLDGTTVLATVTSAPFELSWTPTVLGARTLTARATDDDGAASTSAAVTLNVVPQPNTAPSVTLTAPANGATVVVGNAVTLVAGATDGDGTVTQVEFFAGTTSVGTDASAPYSVAWTPPALGTFVITARATDDDGAIATSAEVTITVVAPPNVPPVVALTAPAAGASVPVNAPLALRATATDADGSVVQVQFLAGTTVIGTVTAAPFEITWTPTTAGAVTLTARATDDDGAIATSVSVAVTVLPPPNVPPTVVLTAPSAGASTVQGQSVTLSATAADADGAVARVEFLVGGSVVGTDATAPFSVTWTPAAAGDYALSARATDDSGAVMTSAVVQFTVLPPPNVAPTVTLTAPPNDSVVVAGSAVTLRATASDADGTVAQVTFHAGATLVGTATQPPYAVTWTPAIPGTYAITARATDDDGATTTSAVVSLSVVPVPNQLPAVSLTAPTAGATLQRGVPVTLRASASDADGSVVRVDFLDDGVLLGSDDAAPFELAWTPMTTGARTLTARAVDDDGGTTTSVGVAVSVVAPPNQAPVITLTAPVAGSSVTIGTAVTMRATATDADGVVARVEFLDGATSIGVATSAPFEVAWTPTTLGVHTLSARATDDSGAVTTSASITVTVVAQPNVAPTVTLTAPAADTTVVVGTTATLRATATDTDGTIASVTFLDGTTPLGTVTQAPFVLAWTPTTTGPHALTAQATDDDGAVTTSAPVNVDVVAPPNQAPTATITSPTTNASYRAGDTISYAGAGADPEDGAIPAARLTWRVDFHHDTHTHPFLAATSGVAGGTLVIPTTGETSDNVWYRVHLAVVDAAGAVDTTWHDVLPLKSTMRFETVPAGLQVTLDGQPRTAPFDEVGVVGIERQLGAPSPQTLGGVEYVFTSWSDGGAASHDIRTPQANTTWTATFTAVAPANQPPTVSVAAPAAGSILTAGTAVMLRADAADADGTVTQVAFFVDGTPVGSVTASPFQVSWTPSALGPHVVTARATDDDGDVTTSAGVSVTVEAAGSGDVTPPSVQLLSPANDTRNLTGSILVRASATDDVGVAGVTFQIDGETIGSEDTAAPYEVTLPSTAPYTTGQHVIRARARDAAGNVSPWAIVTVAFGGNVNLPDGFARTAYVSGLAPATTMAWAPDGRLFVAQQGGALRVVKDGVLLSTPFHTFPTSPDGERGLLGVALDPDFATNRWVYAYYTSPATQRNIVVRVRANGDVSDPSDIDTLLVLPVLTALNHNGGALHFGPDRRLYVATGDNAVASNAPSLNSTLGKILRIEADGTIPADNPFSAQTTGINRAIWARGLRNPFTFGFQPGTGRLFINDVGESSWEEINEGVAGSDYGWPATEGYTTNPAYRSPVFAYPHFNAIVQGFSIVGAAFYNPPTVSFPSAYVGDYFFGDYVHGWVNRMDLDNGNGVYAFARFPGSFIVDVRTGPDGALYVLSNNVNGSWGVWRLQRTP